MDIPGRVHEGVIVLEGGVSLPDGTVVIVSCPGAVDIHPPAPVSRIQVPLIRTGRPASVPLSEERVAELLDDEDVSSRR